MEAEYLPSVKFMVVPIRLGMADSGAMGVREVDALVSEWVDKGYKLLSVVRGEFIPSDRAQVICVLVKE